MVGKGGLQGPVSTGLVLAAQSKAKRTARAFAAVEALAATGVRPGPKARLRHGVRGTLSAMARSQSLAVTATRRHHQTASQEVEPHHANQARKAPDRHTIESKNESCDSRDLSIAPDQQRKQRRPSMRQAAIMPTHPSNLDPTLAVDLVNWRPAAAKSQVLHLPGYRSAGVNSIMHRGSA